MLFFYFLDFEVVVLWVSSECCCKWFPLQKRHAFLKLQRSKGAETCRASERLIQVGGRLPLATTQINTKRRRGLDFEAGSNEIPAAFQVDLRASQLEVIDIGNEEQLQHRMGVTGWPLLRNRLKTH